MVYFVSQHKYKTAKSDARSWPLKAAAAENAPNSRLKALCGVSHRHRHVACDAVHQNDRI